MATQSFENHRRWFPLFHFFVSPVLALFTVHSIVHAVQRPSVSHWMEVIYAIAVWAGIVAARIMALRVQNRVVRLEMRLRLRELLSPALYARMDELRVRHLIALRFAGDAELPSLFERTLAGEFARPKDIKRAITDWQPDYMRA